MKHKAKQQYDYHHWANNRLLKHLHHLPGEVYSKQVNSVFATVAEVITHIYRTDGMWLSVMTGDPLEETMVLIKQHEQEVEGQDLGGMETLYTAMSNKYESFFRSQEDLDVILSIEHPKYGKLECSIAELVQHVVNHGTYHRGNITAMLRQQGHPGVPTDYVFYLYDKS
ncbi:DinB family protein [Fodinibius sediminis]|uniref:Uncharacterized damage-inducible protein DinB (Forms a four-helix bundle) n=1 Tax=Fodinibius sediminis TaxID=1214077 RepID=A0A521BFR1_9BACT|nr:DinB family protein [Fodinibius sediminis]SMO45915.1 Uncharacterized damage-inducible protein DinB (forms a four-helix bundle) [Fodinibius sediminis]